MELVRCDNCKREGYEQEVVDWLHVSRFGIDARGHGDEPGPWHFCTKRCLGEWAVSGGH